MAIKLFDSMSREMRELSPSHPDGVFRFYNCGPTVYAPAHIGNFRTFIINDVLRRLLELEFPGRVRHVRNLTDVDDRTIGQAKAEGRPLAEITRKWTELFHSDCRALSCLPPHVEPSATGNIREQVDMIAVLMKKGNAYRAPDGSVYFKIGSFPGYGALSRIKERELKVTNSVLDADHKDDVGDFALWKAYKAEDDGDVKWPGPEGAAAGRPGWHIECSAMIKRHLGETIDLHTGGVDLLFPHHENEIAQSQCCNGVTFSRHWFHSEHLLSEGTTMSKSKGNYHTLGDLTGKGYSAAAVRYCLLSGHPRKQLNFTLDSLHAAESALKALRRFADALPAAAASKPSGLFDKVGAALRDDLNLPSALGELFVAVNAADPSKASPSDRAAFDQAVGLLGLRLDAANKTTVPSEILHLCQQLSMAIELKDLKLIESIRLNLAEEGWSLAKDGRIDETTKLTPQVKALVMKRGVARFAREFALADQLRKAIADAGWIIMDDKDGSYRLEALKKA